MQLQYAIRKQISRVDLQKDGTTSIGIILKDGVKTGSRPFIKAIKKGSVAYRSHCVSEQDVIVSVCGQDTRGMSRKDFKHLLREAESKIELELEYQIREACLSTCGVYRMERIYMKLRKGSESYGFVLRKYGFKYPTSPGYPVISNIREGGPADRDGRLKAGDRLLRIDDQDLELLSLSQVADILQDRDEATFTVEYKIALVENSQIKLGERTYLEIDCPDADLGLVLGSSGSRMIIEEIHKGSLADRCGAFRVGDDILEINDIDVAFLTTSKANHQLRSFKKRPGKLVLFANMERLARPKQNLRLTRENIKPVVNETPFQPAPESDQQVPSITNFLTPCNSPLSLFNRRVEDGANLVAENDYYNFQLKTILMLKEVINGIVNLENFLSSLTNNNTVDRLTALDEMRNNGIHNQTNRHDKLLHLRALFNSVRTSAYSMAMNLAGNVGMFSIRNPGNNVNSQALNNRNIIQELMTNLIEMHTKKSISKSKLKNLQLKINQINSNCKKCIDSCMLAALTTQKVLLIVSLNTKSKKNFSSIRKLIEEVIEILPCEDCREGSESQTGSEILRNTSRFNSSNNLSPKPSSSGYGLKSKASCSMAQTGPDTSKTDFKSLDLKKPTNSIPSLFSYQTGLESPSSTDYDSSTNVTILKAPVYESNSNFNCQTKSNPTQLSVYYEKRCQKQPKVVDNVSLCFEIPNQSQNQSEAKAFYNSSLGFATPTHSPAFDDRKNISESSTPQPLTGIPSNTQNISLSYEAELRSHQDIEHFEQKDNGKNYSSNVHKKIFREKGLLNSQRHNYKSAEVIAGSENKSFQHSNRKINKHSSEPQFLLSANKSLNEIVSNSIKKEEPIYANVELLEKKNEIDDANTDANRFHSPYGANDERSRYWSPFSRSNGNDHPNILDIPNWSAKSSHSMKKLDQDSNQRTLKDTMDVSLKNDGNGYGLRIEFLDSHLEDLTQLPLITSVSLQGAAHKTGVLQKGDRVLAINGQIITGLTVSEFEHLKEEALGADEVLLTVEFDIIIRDLQFGTFDVYVTKTSKTGLVYNDFKKGSPLVVKGIVKGSPAHRCGSLFPGDEVLSANNIRQEFYDVSKNTYERSEFVIIKVRRQSFKEKFDAEINLEQDDFFPFKTYDLSRTSIHSNHDSNDMFLDQELILYRDPVARDFGFLIGQDQISKTIYVTGIRLGGPADCSKVIRENDMILQVNGVDLEANKDGSVVSLFHPTGDRLELKTRRILKY